MNELWRVGHFFCNFCKLYPILRLGDRTTFFEPAVLINFAFLFFLHNSSVIVPNSVVTLTLHTDSFFRSQRDINRHGSWLDFWKILVNFISGTFGTAWDKYFKNGLTFRCLREKKGWNFDLEIIFFKQKQDFGIFI